MPVVDHRAHLTSRPCPHQCIPRLALQSIGLTDLGFSCTADQLRLLEVGVMEPVSVMDPFSLGLSQVAG